MSLLLSLVLSTAHAQTSMPPPTWVEILEIGTGPETALCAQITALVDRYGESEVVDTLEAHQGITTLSASDETCLAERTSRKLLKAIRPPKALLEQLAGVETDGWGGDFNACHWMEGTGLSGPRLGVLLAESKPPADLEDLYCLARRDTDELVLEMFAYQVVVRDGPRQGLHDLVTSAEEGELSAEEVRQLLVADPPLGRLCQQALGVDVAAAEPPVPEPDQPAQPPTPPPVPPVLPAPTQPPQLPPVAGRLVTGVVANQDAAVVIGLSDYDRIADVPDADKDAEAFRNFLVYTRGIPPHRVQYLDQGTREHIEAAVAELGEQVGPGGTMWVYFAGHGAASTTTRERVLLGDDVRGDAISFDSRSLPISRIEELAGAGGGRVLLILDTCFGGVGRGGDQLIAGKRFLVPEYATQPSSGGVAQWNAASPNELSGSLGTVGHGAFTYLAIGAMRGWADGELSGQRDGEVTGQEAQAFIVRALGALQMREQHPVWVGEGGGAEWVLSEGVEEVGPSFD
ncbi:MAG: caspase family protein [Deltaproteobacteria bacterium]|nr:caspase family protein [Deltaproteobacteria bacterium]